MILCGYAKTLGIAVSEAAKRLLSGGGLNYLEEHYNTLHLLSNEDVVCELIDMSGANAAVGK